MNNFKKPESLTVERSDTPEKKVIGTNRVRSYNGSLYICEEKPTYWMKVKKEENIALRSFFAGSSQDKLSPKTVREKSFSRRQEACHKCIRIES